MENLDSLTVKQETKPYGSELVLGLHGCNPEKFNRADIDAYFTELCRRIDMTKCEVHFWDDEGLPPEECQTLPHTKGTSAVCFIVTSSIVIHTLDILEAVYVTRLQMVRYSPRSGHWA